MWEHWFPKSVDFFVSCASPYFSVALGVCCHCFRASGFDM